MVDFTDGPSDQQIQIEELLTEANAYGLRQEVETTANEIMENNQVITLLDAYQEAYDEWVK